MSPDNQSKKQSNGFNRRDFLKTGALAAAGMLLPGACAKIPGLSAEAGAKRPNIIFILTDDHAFDAIGYASNGRVKTPHLDRLAKNGVIFNRAYCSALTCVPSRTTVLTGLNYHRVEKETKAGWVAPLKEGTWSWAHALRSSGYNTGMIGKSHFTPLWANHGFDTLELCDGAAHRPLEPGQPKLNQYEEYLKSNGIIDYYDRFGRFPKELAHLEEEYKKSFHFQAWCHDTKYHRITWIRDRAVQFIENNKQDGRPFALMITPPYPHAPYVPSKEFVDLYDPDAIDVPEDNWEDMEGLPEAIREPEKTDFFDRKKYSRKVMQGYLAHNWALVSQMDAMVGEILKHVDLRDTMIVFTGDHGDYQGRRGRLAKNPWIPFEETSRVPLLASGWRIPQGVQVDQPVSLVDIAPTLLQAGGAAIPDGLDGVPLQNYWDDRSYGKDRTIYCNGYFAADMVRWRNLQYIDKPGGGAAMLFDLGSDPRTVKNLAGHPDWQDELKMMQQKMTEAQKRPAPSLPHFDIIPLAYKGGA